jgi:hypothetical protein
MMDFVRSLAPARDGTAGRAVPLLRSRVVPPLPSSAAIGAARGEDAEAIDSEAFRLPPVDDDHAGPARSIADPVQARRAPAGARNNSVRGDHAVGSAAEPFAEPDQRPVRERPQGSDAIGSPMARPHAAIGAMSSAPPPRPAVGSPPSSEALPQRRSDATIARAARAEASATRTPAPLTATTLAARASTAVAAPTVIHVSIDRIDLRLPAAAAPARSPQRSRTATTVPLAEYLSGRKAQGAPR